MSKCSHNNPITEFCIKPDCEYRSSAGCEKCFLQEHIHQEPLRISVGELEDTIQKFIFPKKTKPFCKDIQEAFYNYFRYLKQMLKNLQIQAELLCKQAVNNIGFPYLSSSNNFRTYKRINNHDYCAITPQQIFRFINSAKDSSMMMRTYQQQKLYLSQIQKHLQVVSEIDYTISSVHHILQNHGKTSNFEYHPSNIEKISEIVSKIASKTGYPLKRSLQQEPIKPKYKVKHHFSETSNNSETFPNLNTQPIELQHNNEMISNTASSENKEQDVTHHKNIDAQNQKEKEGNNSKGFKIDEQRKKQATQPKKKRQRKYSIDTHLQLKQNNLQKRIAQLKNRVEASREESEMTQTYEQKTMVNFDLPQIEQESNLDHKEFEVIPINRRIEEPDVGPECVSPLLKKKRQFDKEKENKKKSNEQNHKQAQESNQKNSQVRQLTKQQELSYMLLIQSLSLDPENAIKLLEKALQQSQNNLSAVQYLSFLYLESSNYQKCIKLCSKYIKKLLINTKEQVQQSMSLLLCNQSGSLNCLGRYSETVNLLKSYKWKNDKIMKNLGNAYLGLGKYSKAITLYKKVIQCDSEITYNLSVCYYMREEYLAAKLALQSYTVQKTEEWIQLQNHINNKLLTKETKKP